MTSSPQPYLPLYVGEILAATATWDGEARALFMLLLALSWSCGPLPTDPARLAKISGYDPERFAQLWETVSRQFTSSKSGLANQRLEELRQHASRLHAQRIEASRRGVEARANASLELPLGPPLDVSDGQPPDKPNGQPHGEPSDVPFRAGQGRVASARDSEDRISRAREATFEFHQAVLQAYHEICVDLPRVKVWSIKRRQALNARIKERVADKKPAAELSYWRTLFAEVAKSDFLCGRKVNSDFRADLEWLLRPENFIKVIEGKYTNRRSNGR
jgi:uncharacterized protein YdaU (DUF1376 family)